jgi:hypothetical protein
LNIQPTKENSEELVRGGHFSLMYIMTSTLRLPVVSLLVNLFPLVQVKKYMTSSFLIQPAGSKTRIVLDLTPAEAWKSGAVWTKDKWLDVRRDFFILFQANFGVDSDGADGLAFVLQNKDESALSGQQGRYLGYGGENAIKLNLAVEFDTWFYPGRNDIEPDHIAITKNGDINNPLQISGGVRAVPARADKSSIKDGKYHNIWIQWEASTHILSVYFDDMTTPR